MAKEVSPPSDAYPHEVETLCRMISMGASEDEMFDNLSDWKRSRVVSLARAMGMVTKEGQTLRLTKFGRMILENRETEAFRHGIAQYRPYSEMLTYIVEAVAANEKHVSLRPSTITDIFEKMVDGSRSTVRQKTKTFMAVCEKANLGEKLDRPDRFKFEISQITAVLDLRNEEIHLQTHLDEVAKAAPGEGDDVKHQAAKVETKDREYLQAFSMSMAGITVSIEREEDSPVSGELLQELFQEIQKLVIVEVKKKVL